MSKLDTAYTEAKNDNEKKPAFYNLFLNTDFFIPTHDAPKATTENGEDTILPMYVESNEVEYLMLFDSQQRLTDWAQKELPFTVLTGHVIVEMMDADHHWVLNAGTDYTKPFVPGEIIWLKQTVAKAKEQAANSPTNDSVLVRKPQSLPEGLVETLRLHLSNHAGIQRAHLGAVLYASKGKQSHLTLVIEANQQTNATIDTIRAMLVAETESLLGDYDVFDILLHGESNVANEISKSVAAFYSQPE
jgi:hypothetical protein